MFNTLDFTKFLKFYYRWLCCVVVVVMWCCGNRHVVVLLWQSTLLLIVSFFKVQSFKVERQSRSKTKLFFLRH